MSGCCVCLKNEPPLTCIAETDKINGNWHSKLSTCVPEINWQDEWSICNECTHQLNSAWEFRELCLRSDALRSEQPHNYTFEPHNDSSEDEQPTKSLLYCFHCNNSFSCKTTLTEHIQTTHMTIKTEETKQKRKPRVTKFTCDDCTEFFRNSKLLVEHCVQVHKKARNEVKPFKCEICGGRFASSSNLVQHNKYHAGLRTMVCSFCGKGFITSSDLSNHEKQHLNKREYECFYCRKRFNTHKDLRSHTIIKHRDPKTWNYHCERCDKRFHLKANYDAHTRRHLGDKRFPCTVCEKAFITKDELKKHLTSHTNIRAFRCSHCGKEYKNKRVLGVHLVQVHGIGDAKLPLRVKKHKCDVCSRAFYDRNKLNRHVRTHTGEKPFKCHLCDKRFTDRSYVNQHVKVMHSDGGDCEGKVT